MQTSQAISSQVFKVYSASAGLVVMLGIMISFFNTRSINRSIVLLQEQTKKIAKGKIYRYPAHFLTARNKGIGRSLQRHEPKITGT